MGKGGTPHRERRVFGMLNWEAGPGGQVGDGGDWRDRLGEGRGEGGTADASQRRRYAGGG